jgi:heptaprenyl diphosphate synthase
MSKSQKLVFIGMLVSMALVLSYVERNIPFNFTFPGVKLGLANIITLTSLYFLAFTEALFLVFIRVVMSAIFTGSIMSLWYSLSGGLLSLFVMYILIKIFKNKVSTTGVSVAGALFHNIGQLIVVFIVTENITVVFSFFPILAVSAVITGLLIGFVVKYLIVYLNNAIIR